MRHINICLCIFKCVLKRITNQSKKNRNLSLCLSEVFLKPVFSLEKKKKRSEKQILTALKMQIFFFVSFRDHPFRAAESIIYIHTFMSIWSTLKRWHWKPHTEVKNPTTIFKQFCCLDIIYIYILHQSSLKPDVQMRCGFLQRLQSYRWFCLVFGLMLWLYWWL